MTLIHPVCPLCGAINARDIDDPSPFACWTDDCAQVAAERRAQPYTLGGPGTETRSCPWPRPSWVYYLRFADRVKIGTTVDLIKRLRTLPHDEVLAVEPGSYELERERHAQFEHLRIIARREWFSLDNSLTELTADIRAHHGEPTDIIARLS
ncbi:GIY-YIG nuclease family protein [Microbacterium sp. UBA3394]|uniref:GIY-YIG nuclease family protein n=1 Tax=Microbacterium sp. UBA3394 TaxID=1946945 RepID=UPI000C63246C|nr:GIY-YIG nuclease family protein [Microbacterium sp. UBA3394]MAM53554.1 hypothetical protein [Microbacterium sp.]|tara:strand:- start:825 stop:1280 length:456 start_codon:yes stop_codon:yes gene_type:complete